MGTVAQAPEQPASAPKAAPRAAVMIVVVLLMLTGGVFLAKGVVEVADRFAGRTVEEATLLRTAREQAHTSKGRTITRYEVHGVTTGGEPFEFDDRRVFDLAEGRTPMPVRVELSSLSGRVLAVRSDQGTMDGVGGATGLRLALVGIVLGVALAAFGFLLPWQTAARHKARKEGVTPPPPERGAVAMAVIAAVVAVGGTLAWDLLRR